MACALHITRCVGQPEEGYPTCVFPSLRVCVYGWDTSHVVLCAGMHECVLLLLLVMMMLSQDTAHEPEEEGRGMKILHTLVADLAADVKALAADIKTLSAKVLRLEGGR